MTPWPSWSLPVPLIPWQLRWPRARKRGQCQPWRICQGLCCLLGDSVASGSEEGLQTRRSAVAPRDLAFSEPVSSPGNLHSLGSGFSSSAQQRLSRIFHVEE